MMDVLDIVMKHVSTCPGYFIVYLNNGRELSAMGNNAETDSLFLTTLFKLNNLSEDAKGLLLTPVHPRTKKSSFGCQVAVSISAICGFQRISVDSSDADDVQQPADTPLPIVIGSQDELTTLDCLQERKIADRHVRDANRALSGGSKLPNDQRKYQSDITEEPIDNEPTAIIMFDSIQTITIRQK